MSARRSAPAEPARPVAPRLPDEAWVCALASLPEMGPARLRDALSAGTPGEAWQRARAGTLGEPALSARWRVASGKLDVAALWQRHVDAGVGVAVRGSSAYPAPFVDDPEPPAAVFSLGDPSLVCGARVAIVGTRSATRYGTDVAFELGHGLAAAGVGVVSGLALGIDGAAHAGALEAAATEAEGAGPAVAVVGSGVDVIYPRQHRELWRAVAQRGVLLSEVPLGGRPERWRFPARNRLIAALADVVVVVESREQGGSMHTVDEAVRRERVVMAVPGAIRSAASSGTNRLLGECALPATDVGDVLLALGLTPGATRAVADPRPAPAPAVAPVLEAIGWQPVSVDQLVLRTGLGVDRLLLALERLVADGWAAERAGWYERTTRPGA